MGVSALVYDIGAVIYRVLRVFFRPSLRVVEGTELGQAVVESSIGVGLGSMSDLLSSRRVTQA